MPAPERGICVLKSLQGIGTKNLCSCSCVPCVSQTSQSPPTIVNKILMPVRNVGPRGRERFEIEAPVKTLCKLRSSKCSAKSRSWLGVNAELAQLVQIMQTTAPHRSLSCKSFERSANHRPRFRWKLGPSATFFSQRSV